MAICASQILNDYPESLTAVGESDVETYMRQLERTSNIRETEQQFDLLLNGMERCLVEQNRYSRLVSETWKDGKLKQAIVKPMHDGVQKFIGKAPLKAETEEKEVFWEVLEDGYEIRMEKGKVYQLIF